jgi:hypothetical protein
MSWTTLQRQNRIRPHTTSKRELDDLRSVIARDLADAAIPSLSADRRFATAYNAALQAAAMAVACASYRVAGQGHHQATFEAMELAIGPRASALAAYFDTCRRKRNVVDYDAADVITDTEAADILDEAENLRQLVESWITANHPHLSVSPPPASPS